MLQTNLIFGIQKKIKENSSAHSDIKVLEESETTPEVGEVENSNRAEPIMESSFLSSIYEKAEASKKKEEIRTNLIHESFTLRKAEKKLSKDVVYFNYLYENYVPEVFKEQYTELVESIFSDTIKLYQECDVTPRLMTLAVDSSELTEATIEDIYKNNLNETIKNKYTTPLLSGKITELYENEIRDLTKKLIEEGAQIDMEQVKVYLPFEEAVYQFNHDILLPETAMRPIQNFMESMTEEYREFLEETAEDILARLEKKIRLLTSLVAPEMFKKAVDAEGVEAPKMAGITIVVDKNFKNDEDCDEDGVCPDEIVASDPEAAEELADEAEAEAIDDETSDVVGAEEEVRDELDLANKPEDYEAEKAEEEAEESAAEETAEHPEQPGAVDLDLPMEEPSADVDNVPTNDSDVALSGDGEEEGIDPNGEEAQLPGAAEGGEVPGDVDSDDEGGEEEIKELETKEDVSEELPDEEEAEDKEDVSEEEKEEK